MLLTICKCYPITNLNSLFIELNVVNNCWKLLFKTAFKSLVWKRNYIKPAGTKRGKTLMLWIVNQTSLSCLWIIHLCLSCLASHATRQSEHKRSIGFQKLHPHTLSPTFWKIMLNSNSPLSILVLKIPFQLWALSLKKTSKCNILNRLSHSRLNLRNAEQKRSPSKRRSWIVSVEASLQAALDSMRPLAAVN